ncbi:MAG: hypothetical protein Q8O72_12125 [Bacteroidales bacterium]|nr:hypothetical protein [Bacteroidales bacterium]
MKNKWLIGLLTFLVMNCFAQENMLYGIRSATIYYEHSGSGFGTSVLYFDDFGAKRFICTTLYNDSLNGEVVNRYFEHFVKNERVTLKADPKNPVDDLPDNPLANSLISSIYNHKILTGLGYMQSGSCEMLNKTCINYTNQSDSICLWNGIVLKSTLHLSVVSMKVKAVRMVLGSPPDSVFQIKSISINNKN